jgi:hypothetical protein
MRFMIYLWNIVLLDESSKEWILETNEDFYYFKVEPYMPKLAQISSPFKTSQHHFIKDPFLVQIPLLDSHYPAHWQRRVTHRLRSTSNCLSPANSDALRIEMFEMF